MQSTRLVRREVLYILRATCFFLSRFCGRNLTCHFGFGFQDFHSNVWCGISLPSKSHVQRPCTRMHGREEEQQQHQAKEEEEESAKICIISVFIKGFTFLQDRKKAPGHWNCLNDIYANFSASIFFPSQCSFVHFRVLNEVKWKKNGAGRCHFYCKGFCSFDKNLSSREFVWCVKNYTVNVFSRTHDEIISIISSLV